MDFRRALILAIRAYQVLVSPLLGSNCRFYPSCSAYSIQAIEKRGCLAGLWLGILRICKCHPFHPGGVDPAPDSDRHKYTNREP